MNNHSSVSPGRGNSSSQLRAEDEDGSCAGCGRFFIHLPDCPGDVWGDDDYTPMPHVYEKCSKCGMDRRLRHYCSPPLDDLRAIVARGIESGNRSGGYYYALRDALNYIDGLAVSGAEK